MDWTSDNGIINAVGGVQMMKQDFGTSNAEKAVFSMDFSKIQFIGNATSVMGSPPNTGDSKRG